MKTLIALLASGSAFAGTVTFGPASSCPTYCTGFTTDNPAYTLNWLNATYALSTGQDSLSVNGKSYSGAVTAVLTSTVGIYSYYTVSGTLQASDGSVLSVSYALQYWVTHNYSGHPTTVQHRAISGGQLVL